jgi:hypothetical protein
MKLREKMKNATYPPRAFISLMMLGSRNGLKIMLMQAMASAKLCPDLRI